MQVELFVPSAARAADGYVEIVLFGVYALDEQLIKLGSTCRDLGVKNLKVDFNKKSLTMRVRQELVLDEFNLSTPLTSNRISRVSCALLDNIVAYNPHATFAQLARIARECDATFSAAWCRALM